MQIVYVGYATGPFTTASTYRDADRYELVRTVTGEPVRFEGEKLYASPAGLKRLDDWARECPSVVTLEVHRDRREKWRGA